MTAPVDLTSALYLGLRHPSRSLAGWDRLTTGAPAAVREPAAAGPVAAALAGLLAVESAVLARSTLHAALDCVAALAGPGADVLVDAGGYPSWCWGIRATGRRVARFAHHDPADLARRLGGAALVVTDGFCPGCGRVAPLADYLRVTRRRGGLLLVDDTQAVGVLGAPAAGHPYGSGGCGSPLWTGAGGRGLVVVASLAKGLGVPLAVVGGERAVVDRVRDAGPAREHASPPSAADLAAARHALALNARGGDRRRRRLAALVHRLREGLADRGVQAAGGPFPVQSLPVPAARAARATAALAALGIRAVAGRSACGGAAVTLLVTAAHTAEEMDRVAAAAALVLRPARREVRAPWVRAS